MKKPTLQCAILLSVLAILACVYMYTTAGRPALAQEPVPQDAPLRPRALEPLPPGTGFIPPPMDLSHLKGDKMPEGIRAAALPSSFDWRTQGKVTSVKNQSTCGSCYSFAALGSFESRLLIDGEGTYDFSENNAKECNWYETSGTDGGTSCSGGNYYLLASLFSKKGTVLESCDPYVASNVSCNSTCPYQKTLLGWGIISGDAVADTDVLKGYIQTYGPAYTSLYAGYYDAWDTEFGNYNGSYTLYYAGTENTNHAVLIVGWDDSLTHAGGTGGWIVKNSWGTGWGGTCGYGTEGGYFTIAYGSASIGTSSSFLYDWQDYDATGQVMYYDEGGWTASSGYGNTTAWGLCKFIPTSSEDVTRVEFWTTDETTDVDVYLYDDFAGGTLSGLLDSKLNNSFSEAGYHSVALDSPLAVTAGDDVMAVVKFTNDSYTYPVPIDTKGPTESGRTYMSFNGSSWGEKTSGDVAIRLRTGTTTPSCREVTSATISGPTAGLVNQSYTFTTTVSPPDATTPITYTWSSSPDSGQGTNQATYTWAVAGSQTISVSVSNCSGTATVTDAHSITISCREVTSATISGPTAGLVNQSHTFTTTVSPSDATTPITYTWSSSPDSGQGTSQATYTWAVTGSQTISVSVSNCSGTATVTDSHSITVVAPVTTTVEPGTGGTLTDTQNLTTTIEWPADAVTQTVTLVYTPTTPTHPNLQFAGHAFELEAYVGGTLRPGYVFSKPFTITIHYSDDDVAGLDEDDLKLYYWDGSAWEDAASTCTPESNYDRHPDDNWLAVPICHLSEFALGSKGGGVYLPIIMKSYTP